MMMPSISNNFFRGFVDPFNFGDWGDLSKNFFEGTQQGMLKTDVKEMDGNYQLEMELPGYKKEEINAKLENGYLTIEATKQHENEEKDHNQNYVRRERYQGSVSRSFYVGDQIKNEDIKAKFENGILLLTLPKKELIDQANDNWIRIEG